VAESTTSAELPPDHKTTALPSSATTTCLAQAPVASAETERVVKEYPPSVDQLNPAIVLLFVVPPETMNESPLSDAPVAKPKYRPRRLLTSEKVVVA